MSKIRAFVIEGVDFQSGTVVVEIDRSILAPIANILEKADPRKGTGLAVRALGFNLRNACSVLYDEAQIEKFGFQELDPQDAEQPASTGTGG